MKDSMARFSVNSADCHWACTNKALMIIAPDYSWYFHFESCCEWMIEMPTEICKSLLLKKRKTVVSLQF